MLEVQLTDFLEKVKFETSLQEKLKAAGNFDDLVSIANEAGCSISADGLKKAQSEPTDEELESAAGGGRCACTWTSHNTCDCINRSLHDSGLE